jgi:hypothetical protein
MVVKVALWYELWTSLLDLYWIIFLFSDLIIEQALILLHIEKIEEAPTRGMHWPASQMMPLLRSSVTSPLAPCSTANVSVAPGIASSRTTIS